MKRKLFALLLALSLLLSVLSCAMAEAETVTVTDVLGREVTVKKDVQNVVITFNI